MSHIVSTVSCISVRFRGLFKQILENYLQATNGWQKLQILDVWEVERIKEVCGKKPLCSSCAMTV